MDQNIYKPVPVEILDIRAETAVDWTYRLKWSGEKPQPGQFFEVSLPRVGEAPFSISDWNDDWIELTIRKVGLLTNNIFSLDIGDLLHLRGPYGSSFPVEEFASHNAIIAAGGTGLAPVRGLIKQLVKTQGQPHGPSSLTVLAGFKSPGDMLFRSDLEAWSEQTSVSLTVDRDDKHWNGNVGVITTLIPSLDIPDISDVRVVVVGPPLMMKFTIFAFLERKIPSEQIWVSYERRMSCGLGKCGHCKIMDKYVCIDGPVFRYAETENLLD